MYREKKNTPEQEICVSCGFCCDGTLFDKAFLSHGENGTLPEKIEENYFRSEKSEYFSLPCKYFSGKCTIYYKKKAKVCSGFRCRLLTDFQSNKISLLEIAKIIQNVKAHRKEILGLAKLSLNISKELSFREMQTQIDAFETETGETPTKQTENIKARCLILDVLLIKHFKSKCDFDKMIIYPEPDKNESIRIEDRNLAN